MPFVDRKYTGAGNSIGHSGLGRGRDRAILKRDDHRRGHVDFADPVARIVA